MSRIGSQKKGETMIGMNGKSSPLSEAGLSDVCARLGVDAAAIWSIVFTETDPPYAGFLKDRRPQILFERHIFSGLTNGRFDASHPDISNPVAGGYGEAGAFQHDRLAAAMRLDEGAALQSASWGISQVLGENYQMVGYATPQAFVADMLQSEDLQLLAGIKFIEKRGIAGALKARDWVAFAKVYNGPGFRENHYDTQLAANFARASAAPPDIRTRTAQMCLMYLSARQTFADASPSTIDGIFGARTRAAMNVFQAR